MEYDLQTIAAGGPPLATGESPPPAFIAGDENRLAAVALAEHARFQLLVLYGPTGVGKSLLANAIVHQWRAAHPDAETLVTSGADFARRYGIADQTDSLDDLRARHARCQLFVLDGLDQMAAGSPAQELLARTLDALLPEATHVVVTTRRCPAEDPRLVPALASRLAAGLSVPVCLPEEATRLAVVRQAARRLDVRLDEATARLLAGRLKLTVPQLQGFVTRLAGESGGAITRVAARRAIDEHLSQHKPKLTSIAAAVARRYRLTVADLTGRSRRAALVQARGLAMLAARQLYGMSLTEIGRYFGGRDHTTVLNACRKCERNIQSDAGVQQIWEEVQRDLSEH